MTNEQLDKKQKEVLLNKYRDGEPSEFLQYDGFFLPEDEDVDSDGHCIISQKTIDLMHGADVRVMVRIPFPGEDQQRNEMPSFSDIAAMLTKIAGDCEKLNGSPDTYKHGESSGNLDPVYTGLRIVADPVRGDINNLDLLKIKNEITALMEDLKLPIVCIDSIEETETESLAALFG